MLVTLASHTQSSVPIQRCSYAHACSHADCCPYTRHLPLLFAARIHSHLTQTYSGARPLQLPSRSEIARPLALLAVSTTPTSSQHQNINTHKHTSWYVRAPSYARNARLLCCAPRWLSNANIRKQGQLVRMRVYARTARLPRQAPRQFAWSINSRTNIKH